MCRSRRVIIDAPIVHKTATSADGTRVAYYVIGDGPRTWVMPPAMGAPLLSMKYILERFAKSHTIVSWDQRGFFASGAPRDPQAMKVSDHLLDMDAVLDAEGLGDAGRPSFVLGGWSMAVQLSLEYYHHHPDRVRALVLINGPYERALSNVVPIPGAEPFALAAIRAGAAAKRVLNPISRALLGARGAARVLHELGIVAEYSDFFGHVLEEFSRVDWGRYFVMMRHLHHHTAAAYLPEVRVPTLITTGTRDVLTPVKVAERMHRAIAGSELYVIPRATHYVVAEFPELLNARIAAFLGRLG
jgi:pimeloyl-ACP methyl ester carboxylesterase